MARWAAADLSSLAYVNSGSQIVPRALIDTFHARGLPVAQVYGSTESGPVSVALPPDAARSHAGRVGWPAPGVQLRLVDAGGQAVAEADAVVFVHARPVGSQQLNYYGQSSTMYTVQLGVRAYRVSDGSVLWRSGGDQVNFTNLNAAEKAREAVEPLLDTIDGRLDEFRSRKRG